MGLLVYPCPLCTEGQHAWRTNVAYNLHVVSGVLGQVGSSGVLDHVDCSVGFQVQAPSAGARILSAGLGCALLNQAAAKRQPRTCSAFTADLGKLATADDKVNTAC